MNLDDSFNSNPFLTTVIGDFSAKSNKWSEGDRSTIEGSKIDFLTSQFGLSQIIKEPTHIVENSSSYTDLTFTTQPNMVLESGVHHSQDKNCQHQIISATFHLKVMKGQVFITPKQMLIIFNKQLIFLIGRTLSLILMLCPSVHFFQHCLKHSK